jgi:hypothetical protein
LNEGQFTVMDSKGVYVSLESFRFLC